MLLAWWGPHTVSWIHSPLAFFGYWGLFVLCLMVSIFIVILDIRYIRLCYVLEQRELLRQTVDDEAFRRALIATRGQGGDGPPED